MMRQVVRWSLLIAALMLLVPPVHAQTCGELLDGWGEDLDPDAFAEFMFSTACEILWDEYPAQNFDGGQWEKNCSEISSQCRKARHDAGNLVSRLRRAIKKTSWRSCGTLSGAGKSICRDNVTDVNDFLKFCIDEWKDETKSACNDSQAACVQTRCFVSP